MPHKLFSHDLVSPSVHWYCWLVLLTCKNRLPHNLYCVGGDVKHCTIQSNPMTWGCHPDSSECSATTQPYDAAFAVSDDGPSVQHETQGLAEAIQPASATSRTTLTTRWQTTRPSLSVQISVLLTGRSACTLLWESSPTFQSAVYQIPTTELITDLHCSKALHFIYHVQDTYMPFLSSTTWNFACTDLSVTSVQNTKLWYAGKLTDSLTWRPPCFHMLRNVCVVCCLRTCDMHVLMLLFLGCWRL